MGETLDYLNGAEEAGEFDGEFFSGTDPDDFYEDTVEVEVALLKAVLTSLNYEWTTLVKRRRRSAEQSDRMHYVYEMIKAIQELIEE